MMEDSLVIWIEQPTMTLADVVRKLARKGNLRVLINRSQSGSSLPGNRWLDSLLEEEWCETVENPGVIENVDLALVDSRDESWLSKDNTAELSTVFRNARVVVLAADGEICHDNLAAAESIPADRCVGLRLCPIPDGDISLEIVRLYSTAGESLELAHKSMQKLGLPFTFLEFDVAGGLCERIRIPVETEAWRLVREGIAPVSLVDFLAASAFGSSNGLLSQMLQLDPAKRITCAREIAEATFGDSRFQPVAGFPPTDPDSGFWTKLDTGIEQIETVNSSPGEVKSILVLGTPQLVDGWSRVLYEASNGRIRPVAWHFWNVDDLTDEEMQEIAGQGPYQLIMECLIAPVDDRQAVLEIMLENLDRKGQVWVHTLNVPSTITVQSVPPDVVSVGFGGLPLFGENHVIELSRPASSDRSDLASAAAIAKSLGLAPYEVADEPGGVGARMLSMLINSTAYTIREGIVSSPTEADMAAKNIFQLPASPFHLADRIGLDVVEAVMVGLGNFLGEDRYRFCPSLTLRIESGIVGEATGKGFYLP